MPNRRLPHGFAPHGSTLKEGGIGRKSAKFDDSVTSLCDIKHFRTMDLG